jgi:flavin-binding protein dodecin
MSVAKVSEISSTSKTSFEDAIQQGLARANKTIRNIKSLWIKEQHVRVTDGRPASSGQHARDVHAGRLSGRVGQVGRVGRWVYLPWPPALLIRGFRRLWRARPVHGQGHAVPEEVTCAPPVAA